MATAGSGKLSRDSWLGQRNDDAFAGQVFDCPVDGNFEFGNAGEYLMSQLMRCQIVPDDLDVVRFGRIFRQPFDGQPVRASGKGGTLKLAEMDWPVVLDQHDGFAITPNRTARRRHRSTV
jgi:hypothetical protein